MISLKMLLEHWPYVEGFPTVLESALNIKLWLMLMKSDKMFHMVNWTEELKITKTALNIGTRSHVMSNRSNRSGCSVLSRS